MTCVWADPGQFRVREGEDKPLVDCGAVITSDLLAIVDAERLGERVAWEND